MAYQSKYKGKEVEEILDNALLKKEQNLTDDEKKVVKANLGIEDVGKVNDLLSLEISEVGEVSVTYGEKSDFVGGQIRETGELLLEFNIE